ASLPDGSQLEVEAGYVSSWSIGIAARLDGELIHESHPGRTIAYPDKYRETVSAIEATTLGEAMRKSMAGGSDELRAKGYDPGQLARNKVPIVVDLALGLLFFVVAKLTDLSTAALRLLFFVVADVCDLSTAAVDGAGAVIALVVAQRFVKVDLTGGLALFGVVLLLISAGLAIAFQDDMAVKMRGTIVGTISAVL